MGTKEVEELRRVDMLIRQFELVAKSTQNDEQRSRVRVELKQLRSYREKFLALHDVDPRELEEDAGADGLDGFPLLRDLIREQVDPAERLGDIERLRLYMKWFYDEFMIFLTPKRLRLDVKSSLERDKFYTEYHELLRQLEDYLQLASDATQPIISLRRDLAADSRSRSNKMRTNVMIRAARYFSRVRDFAAELIDDLQGDGGACKNGDELLSFAEFPGKRFLGGLTVWHSLQLLQVLAREIVAYLNVPPAALQ